MANLQFDASRVEPQMGFEAYPPGWYKVMADESEMKPAGPNAKDPNGLALHVRLVIMEGKFQGRKVFLRYNMKNSNAQAQEIGHAQLSALAHAVGVLQVADSNQLHNIPFWVKLKIRPAQGEYEAQNEATAYKHISDPPAIVEAAAPAAPGTPPPPAGPTPQPWQQGYQPPPAAAAPAAPTPPAPPAPPPPPPPPAPPPVPTVQRPTDPSHIHAAGTPGEQWWINGAWQPAVAAPPPPPAPPAPPAAPAAPAAPGPWTPPAGGQPWSHQPPAPTAAAAPPAPPAPPPHPAQSTTPPWQRPQS